MNKAKVIGLVVTGLAVIGGIAVYKWVRKPKKNSEGFFNASGTTGKAFPNRCDKCRDVNGDVYVPPRGTNCKKGETCLSNVGYAID